MELQPNRDVGREPNHDQVQVASFLMLAGVIVGLILAIFILGRIWKGLQLKHILRCAFQVNLPGWSILVPLQNISASRLRRL